MKFGYLFSILFAAQFLIHVFSEKPKKSQESEERPTLFDPDPTTDNVVLVWCNLLIF